MEIPDNETENIASSQHFLCIPISGYKGLKIQFQNLNKVGDKTLMSGHTVSAQSLIVVDVSSKTQCLREE